MWGPVPSKTFQLWNSCALPPRFLQTILVYKYFFRYFVTRQLTDYFLYSRASFRLGSAAAAAVTSELEAQQQQQQPHTTSEVVVTANQDELAMLVQQSLASVPGGGGVSPRLDLPSASKVPLSRQGSVRATAIPKRRPSPIPIHNYNNSVSCHI